MGGPGCAFHQSHPGILHPPNQSPGGWGSSHGHMQEASASHSAGPNRHAPNLTPSCGFSTQSLSSNFRSALPKMPLKAHRLHGTGHRLSGSTDRRQTEDDVTSLLQRTTVVFRWVPYAVPSEKPHQSDQRAFLTTGNRLAEKATAHPPPEVNTAHGTSGGPLTAWGPRGQATGSHRGTGMSFCR